jgi:hypothetical protein
MPRLQAEEYTAADAEVLELAGDEERTKLAADPLFRLEHNLDETKRVEPVWKQLAALKDIQDSRYTPAMNSQLRAAFRKRKKQDALTDTRCGNSARRCRPCTRHPARRQLAAPLWTLAADACCS